METLFGDITPLTPPPTKAEVRQQKMRQAHNATSAAFLKAYRRHVLEIAASHAYFVAEDCSESYKRLKHLPQPARDFRCTGQLFADLLNEGLIIHDGEGRSKARGVPVPRFRLK